MQKQDPEPIRQKILAFLETNGPSFPVRIAKEIDMSPLFASAFLSELVNQHKIKLSYMRVGNSPLYMVPGDEARLTHYEDHIKGKEKEAYMLLKERRTLKDSALEPAIRVAMRSIKDFAIPFKRGDELFWRYVTEKESSEQAQSPLQNQEPQEEVIANSSPEKKETITPPQNQNDVPNQEPQEEVITANNATLEERVRAHLQKKNIKLLEETDVKKREFIGIGRIETLFGEQEITIIAKDKKMLNDKDIEKAFELVHEKKRLVLFLCPGEIAKKTREMYRDYKHLILVQELS